MNHYVLSYNNQERIFYSYEDAISYIDSLDQKYYSIRVQTETEEEERERKIKEREENINSLLKD